MYLMYAYHIFTSLQCTHVCTRAHTNMWQPKKNYQIKFVKIVFSIFVPSVMHYCTHSVSVQITCLCTGTICILLLYVFLIKKSNTIYTIHFQNFRTLLLSKRLENSTLDFGIIFFPRRIGAVVVIHACSQCSLQVIVTII